MLWLTIIILYVAVVALIGIKLYSKVGGWLNKLDPILPRVRGSDSFKYGVFAFVLAVFIEGIALYLFRGSGLFLGFFPLVVGFTEEGAKLIPFFASRAGRLYRWRLAVNVAFTFAVIEAILYGLALLFTGNIVGAILRAVVVMYHVAFTVLALESSLRGSPVGGYVGASLLHALYDAPLFVAFFGNNIAVLLTVFLSLGALIYTYRKVDEAFGLVFYLVKRELEERKRESEEYWAERLGRDNSI
jgi:hypothetical protein